MCTLGGFYKLEPNTRRINMDLLSKIINGIDLRGRDAFGAGILYENGNIEKVVENNKENFKQKIKSAHHFDIRGMVMTGRAIPASERVSGEINLQRDTQPFLKLNQSKAIVSHNGIIANDKQLQILFGITPDSPVDSSILPYMSPENFNTIKGSFAIAGIYKDNLWLSTNFMPLFYKEENGIIYWASLPEQLISPYEQLDYYASLHWEWNGLWQRKIPTEQLPRKALVICSGGLDSSVALNLYKYMGYDTTLLYFKYGQKAEEAEEWATDKLAKHLNIEKMVVNVRDIFKNTINSVLLGTKEYSGNRHWDMESTESYVGCRNTLFTVLAMQIAEKTGAGVIALGLNLDDGGAYPDNNWTFLKDINRIGKTGMNWNAYVDVKAPFINLTKKEIIEVGLFLETPFHYQASCYYPEIVDNEIIYCGKCGCDKLREYSFKALGLMDPVYYEKEPSWIGYKNISSYKKSSHLPYKEYIDI